jgi:predicted transposase YdaD
MLKRSQPKYSIDEKALKKRRFFSELLEEIKLNKLNKKQMRAYRLSEKDYDKLKVYMSGSIHEGREQGFKEGIQQGMQQGIQEGMQQGIQQGMQQGRQEGMQQGIQQGRQEGIQQGRQEGMQESMRQVAISALKLGYTCQDVSALTGLTLEQVTELHKSAALS